MCDTVIIAHNLRSCHNVGALLRTADGLGVRRVYLTGYTPYPPMTNDTRFPHLARKIGAHIHKTALGAENSVSWTHQENIEQVIESLKSEGYTVAALEQSPGSIALPTFRSDTPIALILGREVEGVEREVLVQCDMSLEIPMVGAKESFNVASAAAMALYHLTFVSPS